MFIDFFATRRLNSYNVFIETDRMRHGINNVSYLAHWWQQTMIRGPIHLWEPMTDVANVWPMSNLMLLMALDETMVRD